LRFNDHFRFTITDEPGFYESLGYSNNADPWKEERFEKDCDKTSFDSVVSEGCIIIETGRVLR